MASPRFNKAHFSEISSPVEPEPGNYRWKPVRHHFGVRSFGVNVQIGEREGDWVVDDHVESSASGTRHEELYLVLCGRARFEVDGQELDATQGTFVHVPDPDVRRGARALEPGTTVLAIGGEPGAPYVVSRWEKKYFPEG
jgi:hypothetical protein